MFLPETAASSEIRTREAEHLESFHNINPCVGRRETRGPFSPGYTERRLPIMRATSLPLPRPQTLLILPGYTIARTDSRGSWLGVSKSRKHVKKHSTPFERRARVKIEESAKGHPGYSAQAVFQIQTGSHCTDSEFSFQPPSFHR